MGYIPPVRDEQAVQYGNRVIHSYRGIKPTSPVLKGKFDEVLSDQEKKGFYRHIKYGNKQFKDKSNKVMSELTGKGSHFDEVI